MYWLLLTHVVLKSRLNKTSEQSLVAALHIQWQDGYALLSCANYCVDSSSYTVLYWGYHWLLSVILSPAMAEQWCIHLALPHSHSRTKHILSLDIRDRWSCWSHSSWGTRPTSDKLNSEILTQSQQLIFTLIFVPVSIRYLERLWGAIEILKFIVIVNSIPNIISFALNWLEYLVFRNADTFLYVHHILWSSIGR